MTAFKALPSPHTRVGVVWLSLTVMFFAAAAAAASASAAIPSPGWTVSSFAAPTNFSTADTPRCKTDVPEPFCDSFRVTATNAGSRPTDGSEITFADTVPAGLKIAENRGNPALRMEWSGTPEGVCSAESCGHEANLAELGLCAVAPSGSNSVVTCTLPEVLFVIAGHGVQPGDMLRLEIPLTVEPSASFNQPCPPGLTASTGCVSNRVELSGGGTPPASTSAPSSPANTVNAPAPTFGLSSFDFHIAGIDGRQDTQAGDHPYALTTTIGLNNAFRQGPQGVPADTGPSDLKDVVVDLPLGFAGSTLAAPRCSLTQLSGGTCPRNTRVGTLQTTPAGAVSIGDFGRENLFSGPIYNLTPERGVAGEFGYVDAQRGAHVFYARVVPSPAGYVLQVVSPNIPQIDLAHIVVTFFGYPEEKAAELQQRLTEEELQKQGVPNPHVERGQLGANVPFFTGPSACGGGPLVATVYADSWQNPGTFNAAGTPEGQPNWVKVTSSSPPLSGCDLLSFTPELSTVPTTREADKPSGLEFELKVPQTEAVGVSATPALKNATVTFPEGMTVDPSSGSGLQACSTVQIGWLGGSPFNFNGAPPACPEASKIGSLELETPLIPGVLNGEIFLAAQNENPFGSVFATYVVVNDPVTGVVLKIAGELKSDPRTGRLTAFFPENAQLPFSALKLHFFGGPRAELATPESCGTYTVNSVLEPWSAPDSGPNAEPFSSFTIDEGCVGGFHPLFTGGSTNLQAGAFTTFVASFSRADTDQELGGLSVTLPPGLLANVGSVPQCTDAQIAQARAGTGGCPASTQVGTVTAGAGPGPNPLFVTGHAYLTGPYNGGPYGLAVVVPAVAGPFHLGNVVVRQSLRIDTHSVQVTDVSDPFPTFLDPVGSNGQTAGIPIKLRRVDVNIDRPSFTFNPTNCSKLQVTGAITSVQGATSPVADPFQVTNCALLHFKPQFSVSTSGKTSRQNGASLHVELAYPKAPFGSQANIASVKVDLPRVLPSRLKTLQHACLARVFEANPAACPVESIVGQAKATTPLLPVPLEGPAYFVSRGGEAFPQLILVLQGNGVTIHLVGDTFISKAGITSSTFKTVPDAPVGTFELTLPEGKYSALAANGDLCASTLAMPTEFVAQNGAMIVQSTPVSVTGCAKKKALTRAQKLAAALRACNRKAKGKRAACRASARRRYGPLAKRKKSRGRGGA